MVDHESRSSGKTPTSRVRKTGPTKYCGVISALIKEPEKANRSKGDYFCIICDSSFTRREGVNYHFPSCVEKHGNPEGHRWNDHASCSTGTTTEEAPAAEKRRITINVSSAKPSGTQRVAQPRAPPSSDSVAQVPRVTRSRQIQTNAQHQTSSQPVIQLVQSVQSAPPSQPISTIQITQRPIRKPRSLKTAKGSQLSVAKPRPRNQKYQIDYGLRPLYNIDDIFHDLVLRALEIPEMAEALERLFELWFHVGTMCSGTESPILALNKIDNGKHRFRPLI